MHDFIDERCNETVLSGMEDCYDVEPVDLTVLIDGCGEVELNSFDIDPSMVPFTGWYFADVPISLEGEEECEGAEFLYWEVLDGDVVIDDIQNPIIEIQLTGNATIMAHFGEPVPPEVVEFNVEPAGVGDILLNGLVIGPTPMSRSSSTGTTTSPRRQTRGGRSRTGAIRTTPSFPISRPPTRPYSWTRAAR